ncbi:YqaA family protein [candidate division KSB1 bacterium]
MVENKNPKEDYNLIGKRASFNIKTALVILEIAFVAVLLFIWLSSGTIKKSTNLWVLFLYCFPAEFLIAIVPHEPILFYFSKFYSAFIIAVVSVAGTLLTEALNYSVFEYFADIKLFLKLRENKFTEKLIKLFNKFPFAALWIAGFTPVPFYPMRFLVVLAKYPVKMYLLAVFLSRTPRFYLLALLGYVINIPDYLLLIIFVILILIGFAPIAKNLFKKNNPDADNVE